MPQEVVSAMTNCEQSPGVSILDHGLLVAKKFKELYDFLAGGSISEWKLPDWVLEHKEFLRDSLLSSDILETYHIYHDCGKPYCLEIDKDGKRHFPNHAEISSEIWNKIGGSHQVSILISKDMDIHTIKAKDVEEFADQKEAISLLLTGLAEIHANAEMFGGIESTSFKIKWKQIDRRGKAIIRHLIVNTV